MNKEELDIYLRSYIGHEYSDLKEIVRYYNFKSIDDAITNIHHIQKMNYPIKEIDSLDTYFPKEFLFKKHGRFTAFAPHKHNWIELAYIYSGEISEIINGSSITLKTGDLIILDRNVIHSTDIAGFNDIMLSFILNIDYFNNSFFSQLMSSNIITNFLLHSLYEMHKYNTYLLFQTKDNEDIHNIICKLATEFISPNIGSDIVKDNYIKILFTELLRIYDSENNKENDINKNTQVSFDILNYIKANYNTINLSSAAKHFNFNTNYFSSFVKKITGLNFKDLILNEKLEKSSYLLRNTDMSIESICQEVNISNINFFYKKFKERYNVTPNKYRK